MVRNRSSLVITCSKEEHEVGFQVAAYDASMPLIIDPVFGDSTYIGGGST